MVARLSREPVVHFLAIGLLLFLVYSAVGGGSGDRTIRVDDKVVAALVDQFQRTWQRPPTSDELTTLVQSHIREEIFYREGLALGLDRDDPTIRRRVKQKFELLAEESEVAEAPTDVQLSKWLRANANRYADPALVTFDQILFMRAGFDAELQSARSALAAGADPRDLGTGRMILPRFERFPIDLVERDFGASFARGLLSVRRGQWEGPIRSGYGTHLVRVEEIIPGRVPTLDEVRKAVSRDFEADRRARSANNAYQRLRDSYSIDVTAKLPEKSGI